MTRKGKITGSAAALAVAISFIAGWEGVRLKAYQDVVGVWTVCMGETKGVKPGDTHTRAECDAMFAARLAEFEAGVDKCLTAPVPTETKIAFVSFAYNVGTGAFCKSTLVRKANAGDLKGACNELPKWNKAGGQVIRGLTNRRIAERDLCLAGLSK